jgi:membrane-bound metal-dependent hydrolase YbcI (DUF457 family)
MTSESFAVVASYQRARLRDIRLLYDQLEPGLEHYLGVERGISRELDSLEGESADIRKTLLSLGADLPGPEYAIGPASPNAPSSPQHRRADTGSAEDFGDLVRRAEAYLHDAGVNPNRDPLLQVLGPSEVAEIESLYRSEFGGVTWDEADYLAVFLAGFVATLLDVFLVRIPADAAFLGKMQQGSPLTKWIKEHSASVHHDYLGHLEKAAKVPYDLSIGKAVDGLRPKVHRLMSPGHDPLLGFIFGVKDIMDGTGTYIDKNGDLRRIRASMSPEGLTVAFLKVFLHLLSDVATSAGIQPPFFTLLQLVKVRSTFILGPSGERVSWTDVARYMYAHGYDLRHFATMGIVPASVEMIVRAWWLCKNFQSGEEPELAKAKLTSMLLLGHTMAASGNLLKTGVIFGMNPLALNWAQMLALFPVAIAWVRESLKRDRAIRAALDEEWLSLYRANPGYSP